MLTVPEAARRARKDPETIRRWIRAGRLPSRKVGTQHVIDEGDLDELLEPEELRVPAAWRWERTIDGKPMPNIVGVIRRSRHGH